MSALKRIFECAHHSPRTSLLDKGIYPRFKECWLKPAVLKKKKKKPVPGARDTGRKRSALSLGRSQSGRRIEKPAKKWCCRGAINGACKRKLLFLFFSVMLIIF